MFTGLPRLIGMRKQSSVAGRYSGQEMCSRRRSEASAHFYGEALRARLAHAFALDPELTPTPVRAARMSRARSQT
jgi:hypothetical protein